MTYGQLSNHIMLILWNRHQVYLRRRFLTPLRYVRNDIMVFRDVEEAEDAAYHAASSASSILPIRMAVIPTAGRNPRLFTTRSYRSLNALQYLMPYGQSLKHLTMICVIMAIIEPCNIHIQHDIWAIVKSHNTNIIEKASGVSEKEIPHSTALRSE